MCLATIEPQHNGVKTFINSRLHTISSDFNHSFICKCHCSYSAGTVVFWFKHLVKISQISYNIIDSRIYDFFVAINWYDWLQIKIFISWSMNCWNFCRTFKIIVELFSVKMTKLFSPIVHGLGWWRSSFLAKIAVLFLFFFTRFWRSPISI